MKTPYKLLGHLFIFMLSPSVCIAQLEVTIAYVGSTEHPAYSGVTQGLTEANLQGKFLGQKYNIAVFADAPTHSEGYLALVAAVEADELLLLREKNRHITIFNLVAKDDHLRSNCLGNILSIIPGRKMLDDAIMQWRQKDPDSTAISMAWHEDFVKFAARDLNKRYRKNFHKGMDEYAWAGWAAMRMIADTVARESFSDPLSLLHYLKTNLAFDGQKGLNMNFRETGQLRQLLLIVENNKLTGEAPVRGVSSDIDSLGIPECVK